MKILIVDDYPTMLRNVGNALRQMGFHDITEAANGRAAFELLKRGGFGLVISDWNMPEMTGIDLLRAVRADAALAAMPFIMATSDGKQSSILMAAAAGVNGYIVKPFSAEMLQAEITRILGPLPSAA